MNLASATSVALVYRESIQSARLWVAVALCSGFAQLFRSSVEVFIGIVYIIAAIFMVVAVRTRREVLITAAYGGLALAFAARCLSAPFIDGITWHGAIIVFSAWGAMAYVNLRWAFHLARLRE